MFTTTSIIPGCTKLYLVTVLTNYSWLCLHFSEAGFEPTASGLLRNALTTPPNFEIKSLTFNCLIFDSSIHSFVRRVLLPFFLFMFTIEVSQFVYGVFFFVYLLNLFQRFMFCFQLFITCLDICVYQMLTFLLIDVMANQ